MKVRISPKAASDVRPICDYVKDRNPQAALRVRESLQTSIQIISLHPAIGRLLQRRVRRYSVPRLPYLIFYRADDEAGVVEILTIRHGARKPETPS